MQRTHFGARAADFIGRATHRALHGSDIAIGQVAPLTGLLASTGARMVEGARIYFDYINSTGGIHGRRIRHVVLDDGHRVEDTLRLTRELLKRHDIAALFGFAGTENIAALLAEGVLEAGGAPLVAPYTGGEPLRNPFNRWIFHLRAGYVDEAERIVLREVDQGRTRFALMGSADALGRAGAGAMQAALGRRGLALVGEGSFERNTERVEHAVERLIAAQPEVVVMFSTNRTTACFVRRYRAAGGTAVLYNVSILDTEEVVELAGADACGLLVTQVVPSPHRKCLPAVREFHSLLRRFAPGSSPNYTNFEEFLGAKLLVEGLRRAGPGPRRTSLMVALETIGPLDLGGITVAYSPRSRIGSRRVDFTVVDDVGELAPADPVGESASTSEFAADAWPFATAAHRGGMGAGARAR